MRVLFIEDQLFHDFTILLVQHEQTNKRQGNQ